MLIAEGFSPGVLLGCMLQRYEDLQFDGVITLENWKLYIPDVAMFADNILEN